MQAEIKIGPIAYIQIRQLADAIQIIWYVADGEPRIVYANTTADARRVVSEALAMILGIPDEVSDSPTRKVWPTCG